jgi:hypothetical protein
LEGLQTKKLYVIENVMFERRVIQVIDFGTTSFRYKVLTSSIDELRYATTKEKIGCVMTRTGYTFNFSIKEFDPKDAPLYIGCAYVSEAFKKKFFKK